MFETKSTNMQRAIDIAKFVIGCLLYAASVQWIYHPANLISGGLTGISMIINYLTHWPVGVMVAIMNVPLLIVAWRTNGLRFTFMSIIGIAVSSIAIDLMALVTVKITDEPLLSSIYGGIIHGLGLGMVFSAGATTGGTDVVANLIRQKMPYVNLGTFILWLDVAVVAVYAIIFKSYDLALYTIISSFISAKAVDLVLYGTTQQKLCFIISEHSDEIRQGIVDELFRGVTVLQGKGAYSGLDKQVLMCVVKRRQIVEVKRIVRTVDVNAFVIVSEAREVFGKNFGDITVD